MAHQLQGYWAPASGLPDAGEGGTLRRHDSFSSNPHHVVVEGHDDRDKSSEMVPLNRGPVEDDSDLPKPCPTARRGRFGSCNSTKASFLLGAGVGLLLVLLGVATIVAMVHDDETSEHQGLSPDLVGDVSHKLPAGVNITVPPSSGPIKQGTSTGSGAGPPLDPRVNYSVLLKPGFHLTPPSGWMNDPNGMFQAPGGPAHVFYQWNPNTPKWGSPWWGHVVSWDYVKWQQLPPALKPDQWYDQDGVFSGSATVLPDGSPLMLYTGVMNFSQYGFYYQQQAAAVPANLSDPLLTEWVKLSTNPMSMEIPPGGTHAQFRDPTTAWLVSQHTEDLDGLLAALNATASVRMPSSPSHQVVTGTGPALNQSGGNVSLQVEGVWMTAVGTLDDCIGSAALYLSNDSSLRTWQYAGTLFSQLSQDWNASKSCLPSPDERDRVSPPGSRDYGSSWCDQFGKHCRMWECPDFFPAAPGVQAFKYSDQSRDRYPWAADFYVLGDTRLINYTNALVQDGQDAYRGWLNGMPYAARPIDWGIVYASKSFSPANSSRVLWLGWVYEDSLGCDGVCADGTPFILDQLQWQGAQTLIREITYAPETRTLRFQPMQELQQLRQPTPLFDSDFTLDTAAAAADRPASMVLLAGREADAIAQQQPTSGSGSSETSRGYSSVSGGRQVEVLLTFSLVMPVSEQAGGAQEQQGTAGCKGREPVSMVLRIHTGNSTYTDIRLNGTVNCSSSDTSTSLMRKREASPILDALTVHVDRSHSGGMTPTKKHGGPIPLPINLAATDLQLQVFVDRSIIEVYALSGSAVVTSRIYPTPVLPADGSADAGQLGPEGQDPPALGVWGYEVLGTWAGGKVQGHAQVYEIGSCWELSS